MATVQNVIDASIARYIDPDKTTWADTELLAYTQKAYDYTNQQLILRNDPIALSSFTVSITDGTELYPFPDSLFLAMYGGAKVGESGVWITDKFLIPCRETERVSYANSGEAEPDKYYLTNDYIGFLPVPDTSYTVTCRYFARPSTLTVSSVMPYNNLFNEAISAFVTSMANARLQQDISGITDLYNELEKKALGVASVRNQVRPKMRNRQK